MVSKGGFKDRVIQVIKKIPEGRVTTYGTVAIIAGLPRGSRLVGGILHQNYQKYNLDWHRVVNREGFISIKCLDHSKELQKALLSREGIEVGDDFIVNLERYGWFGE